jgi:hypothetical protein
MSAGAAIVRISGADIEKFIAELERGPTLHAKLRALLKFGELALMEAGFSEAEQARLLGLVRTLHRAVFERGD